MPRMTSGATEGDVLQRGPGGIVTILIPPGTTPETMTDVV